RSFRSVGAWSEAAAAAKGAYRPSLVGGDRSYFFTAAAVSSSVAPSHFDSLYRAGYPRVLLLSVPSSLVWSKPGATQRVLARMINRGSYEAGATFPPSMIGDSFINLGYAGVIVALAFGMLLRSWQASLDGNLGINKITVGSAGFVF